MFPENISNAATDSVLTVVGKIIAALGDHPEKALSLNFSPSRNKLALVVDEDAEDNFRDAFQAQIHDANIWGEESIKPETNFTNERGLFALVDMVDGTDLLERNLSNWCSAGVFFYPERKEGKRIVAACVGMPSRRVYYAYEGLNEVRYQQMRWDPVQQRKIIKWDRAKGTSGVKKLQNASICFYGQKATSLLKVADTKLFNYLAEKQLERESRKKKGEKRTKVVVDKEKENRIYNLSGIPMMMRLIDHQVKEAATIDVILQLGGQHPHDAVPGLYIARKGGAFILNLKTQKEMTEEELDQGLLRPGHPDEGMEYIVGATENLCREILPLLEKKQLVA
jgi:fructose-1,6-bisphosphatase/inositol monophosphatase family enzyme